jgi:hypothetical protein
MITLTIVTLLAIGHRLRKYVKDKKKRKKAAMRLRAEEEQAAAAKLGDRLAEKSWPPLADGEDDETAAPKRPTISYIELDASAKENAATGGNDVSEAATKAARLEATPTAAAAATTTTTTTTSRPSKNKDG